jgi:hypothetical protein
VLCCLFHDRREVRAVWKVEAVQFPFHIRLTLIGCLPNRTLYREVACCRSPDLRPLTMDNVVSRANTTCGLKEEHSKWLHEEQLGILGY